MVASSNEPTRWVTHKELTQSAISTAVRKVDSWLVYFPKSEEGSLCMVPSGYKECCCHNNRNTLYHRFTNFLVMKRTQRLKGYVSYKSSKLM